MSKWKVGTEDDYYVKTCAWSGPGCHPVGCGLKVHVKDGKIVGIEGDEDHPITNGRLCVRCLALEECVYHPDRILYPLKRVGNRGEDKWQRISWDEAYDIIEENVRRIQKDYGHEAIFLLGGTGREATLYYPALANAVLQTPNSSTGLTGLSCYGPRCAVTEFTCGTGYPEIDHAAWFPDRYDNPEFVLPKYIVVWGKNPLDSNADGFFGHAIIDMCKRGSKLIVVDPRTTLLAARADYHLKLRPGTDAALALGMLNVILSEDLYDHEFVDKWCYGFGDLKKRAAEYPLDKVEEITWVPKELIAEAARAYATSKPSSVAWGVATEMQRNGVQAIQGILYMIAITGNLDVPGGNTLSEASSFMGKWRFTTAQEIPEHCRNNRMDGNRWPFFSKAIGAVQPDEVLETLETGKPYEMKMLWINSTNIMACGGTAEPQRWHKACKKIEFIVVQELFMTPTASALADIILPMATTLEHDGVVLPHFGRNTPFVGAMNRAIEPLGEVKSDLQICLELGKRLNPKAWPWKDVDEFFTEQIKPKLGIDFKELQDRVVVQQKYTYRKYEKGLLRQDGQPGFETLTGLVELKATVFENWGDDPLPYFWEPPYSPYSTPDLWKEYPLVLTTGGRRITSFHSEHRQIPSLRAIDPYPTVEIHPETAEKYGIKEGDWVCIENMFGKARQKAHITPTVDPRVVHARHAWWYPEQDITEPNLGGAWKSNINTLIPNKHVGKMGLGAPLKNMICKIYRVDGLD